MSALVVKLGGQTLAQDQAVLAEVAALHDQEPIVLVHGGGRRLTDWLERLGIETSFEAGRRVTDDAALEVAVAVLAGLVNTEIVASLQRLGVPAVGLTGADSGLLEIERVAELGRVGRVTGAHTELLEMLTAAGSVVVVAPIATDTAGLLCNVNADEVAAGLAAALGGRLILLTDTDGVHDAAGKRIDQLDAATAQRLIDAGVIAAGMIPKVTAALAIAGRDGAQVVIANGRAEGALRRALADPAFGTRVVGR